MGYAKYFNEKYDRSGALFQGEYKSILDWLKEIDLEASEIKNYFLE